MFEVGEGKEKGKGALSIWLEDPSFFGGRGSSANTCLDVNLLPSDASLMLMHIKQHEMVGVGSC